MGSTVSLDTRVRAGYGVPLKHALVFHAFKSFSENMVVSTGMRCILAEVKGLRICFGVRHPHALGQTLDALRGEWQWGVKINSREARVDVLQPRLAHVVVRVPWVTTTILFRLKLTIRVKRVDRTLTLTCEEYSLIDDTPLGELSRHYELTLACKAKQQS